MTGTPWADSPLHPWVAPDAEAVRLGEADPEACDECGEREEHWKHNVPDPSLDGEG